VPSSAGRVAVAIEYPAAVRDQDLTYRPRFATGGVVRFRVGSKIKRVQSKHRKQFSVRVPPGKAVTVAKSAARDRYGNRNGAGVSLRPPA
jgi:hypothetical protein